MTAEKLFWDIESLIEQGINAEEIRRALDDAIKTGNPQGVEWNNKRVILHPLTKKIFISESAPLKLTIFGNGNMLLKNKITGEFIVKND